MKAISENFPIKQIEDNIGYVFRDKQKLITAFTHLSFSNECGGEKSGNEKYEFLGDSILGFIVSEILFSKNLLDEGELTEVKKTIVSREPLAYAIKKLDIIQYLRLGKGAKKDLSDSKNHTKFQSNVYEAILGAIYLDSLSISQCRKFILHTLSDVINDSLKKGDLSLFVDYKTRLQEQAHKMGGLTVKYATNNTTDSINDPYFEAKAMMDGMLIGTGFGKKKKAAEQSAAKDGLTKLNGESNKRA